MPQLKTYCIIITIIIAFVHGKIKLGGIFELKCVCEECIRTEIMQTYDLRRNVSNFKVISVSHFEILS